MQVFKIIPNHRYFYGCAIIAANNREEAIEVFKDSDEFNDSLYSEGRCTCDIIDKLDYDCSKPTVIVDTVQEE